MASPSLERHDLAAVSLVCRVKLADRPLNVGAERRSAHPVLPSAAPAVRRGENDRAFNFNVDVVDPSNPFIHSPITSVVPTLRNHESSDVGKRYLSLTCVNNGLGATTATTIGTTARAMYGRAAGFVEH